MKKGAKAIRCYECNKIIGWEIPTGKCHHGISEVSIKLNDDGNIVDKSMARYYYCDSCKPGTR